MSRVRAILGATDCNTGAAQRTPLVAREALQDLARSLVRAALPILVAHDDLREPFGRRLRRVLHDPPQPEAASPVTDPDYPGFPGAVAMACFWRTELDPLVEGLRAWHDPELAAALATGAAVAESSVVAHVRIRQLRLEQRHSEAARYAPE